MDQIDYVFKVLLIGDSGVGKSSLLRRYVDDEYSDSFVSTIGVDFRLRNVRLNGATVRLQLWDTAGQERFRTITASYYRGAQALLLVYDASDRESFAHLQRWLDESQRYADQPVVVVVGNKADLERAVPADEAQRWADAHGCALVECSAKDKAAVDQLFANLARACVAAKPKARRAPDTIELPSGDASARQCCLA
jgi:small GTP-binding protein